MIFDIDIRYRSSGSTISVTYDIEEQRYRSFSYDIEVLATISKNYDIEETSISKSETSISGCQGSRCRQLDSSGSGIPLQYVICMYTVCKSYEKRMDPDL